MSRLPPSSTLFPYPTLFRSVVIGLTVLLLLLIVPLHWGLRAGGCLLLLLGPNHPTSLLLLGSPVLSVRYDPEADRKSTRLNSSHPPISYAVFCLKKNILCPL